MVGASVIALSVVGVYFAAYVLSVSNLSCLSLFMLYFHYTLQVVMVIFAFKLARLIDANRHVISQHT
jgi:hypothetical protein